MYGKAGYGKPDGTRSDYGLYLKDGGRPEPEAKKDEKKGLADFSESPLIFCGALEQD